MLTCLLVGCGGASTPPVAELRAPAAYATPRSVVAAATPGPAAPAAARLGDIVWAADIDPDTGAPRVVAATFPADAPRLTAVTLATDVPRGTAVEAVWTYNDTSLDAFTTRLEVGEAAPRRWLSFHLDRDPETPWPAGTYAVELTLGGIPAQRAEVDVRADG